MYTNNKLYTDIEYLKGLGLTGYEAKQFLLSIIIDSREGLDFRLRR